MHRTTLNHTKGPLSLGRTLPQRCVLEAQAEMSAAKSRYVHLLSWRLEGTSPKDAVASTADPWWEGAGASLAGLGL